MALGFQGFRSFEGLKHQSFWYRWRWRLRCDPSLIRYFGDPSCELGECASRKQEFVLLFWCLFDFELRLCVAGRFFSPGMCSSKRELLL
jgi:hypothetical protein